MTRLRGLATLALLGSLSCGHGNSTATRAPNPIADRPRVTSNVLRADYAGSAACKDCHPKHYTQWSGSMHAYASDDPVFVAMNKRGQREAQLGSFCLQCHAPMAVALHPNRDRRVDLAPHEHQQEGADE